MCLLTIGCTTSKRVSKFTSSSDTTRTEKIDTLSQSHRIDTSFFSHNYLAPATDQTAEIPFNPDRDNQFFLFPVDTTITLETKTGSITVHTSETGITVKCHEDEKQITIDSLMTIHRNDAVVIEKLREEKINTQKSETTDTTKTNNFWKYLCFLLIGICVILGIPYIGKLIKP